MIWTREKRHVVVMRPSSGMFKAGAGPGEVLTPQALAPHRKKEEKCCALRIAPA